MRVLPAGRAPRTSAGRRSPKPRRHTTCISSNSTTRAGPYPEPPAGTNPGHKDASARQLRLVVERLHEVAAKQRIRIFVFVHGWKHNAAFDDDNVIHFRDFLKASAQYELTAQSDARVVGIYVGWPGKSLGLGEPAISATFWDRKIATQHVAVGSVRELTAQLRALQRECAQWVLEPASAAKAKLQLPR